MATQIRITIPNNPLWWFPFCATLSWFTLLNRFLESRGALSNTHFAGETHSAGTLRPAVRERQKCSHCSSLGSVRKQPEMQNY